MAEQCREAQEQVKKAEVLFFIFVDVKLFFLFFFFFFFFFPWLAGWLAGWLKIDF